MGTRGKTPSPNNGRWPPPNSWNRWPEPHGQWVNPGHQNYKAYKTQGKGNHPGRSGAKAKAREAALRTQAKEPSSADRNGMRSKMQIDLWKVTTALREWGDRWDASGFGAAPLELVDRETGRDLRLALVDPDTGRAVPPGRVHLRPGPAADDQGRALLARLNPGDQT